MSRWTSLAAWRPTTHHGDAMDEYRGLVAHIAEGFYEGTIAWQQGDNGVSSHFVVGREPGQCAQLVDTDVAAWTQRAGNGRWLSVEFAGFTRGHRLHRTHPTWHELTPWQIEIGARLLVQAHEQYGVPLQLATSAAGRGLGHHSMGGESWGHRDCPGPPIIAQKAEILSYARLLTKQVPPGNGEDEEMTKDERALLDLVPKVLKAVRQTADNVQNTREDVAALRAEIKALKAGTVTQ